MRYIEDVLALREVLHRERARGCTVDFVPTMGYLHRGHARLLETASGENGLTVASIFVNPTQFGPNEDLARYPRDPERDRAIAEAAGVDIVFAPSVEAMYPDGPEGQMVWVDPGPLGDRLCGASRPGHFRGVATVVAKLFNMVQPDRAYFGQKDAQQALIISAMVRSLAFPIEVCVVPTVREPDGLALSSRNVYLDAGQRVQASALFAALEEARVAVRAGERDAGALEALVRRQIERHAPDARIDYVAVVSPDTLASVAGIIPPRVLIAVAAYFGSTRLIDNLTVQY